MSVLWLLVNECMSILARANVFSMVVGASHHNLCTNLIPSRKPLEEFMLDLFVCVCVPYTEQFTNGVLSKGL